jgi:hypothetical protein
MSNQYPYRRPTMSDQTLPSTRPGSALITFDKMRGKVGWAWWRRRQKKRLHRYNRRVDDHAVIRFELEQNDNA